MWVKLDDHFVDHPKVIAAGPLAGWLYVAGLCYANRYLTDGFIPDSQVARLIAANGSAGGNGKRPCSPELLAEKLCAVGLWKVVKVRGQNGFKIHDFLKYQPAKKTVIEEREWNARRQALYRNTDLLNEIRARDAGKCRYCGVEVNWKDRRGTQGGTYDHVVPRGPDKAENIVVACRGCNTKKGNRSITEARMTLLEN